MERSCDACGVTYRAERRASRFCTDRCRKRWHRGVRSPGLAAERNRSGPGAVEQATRAQLAAVGREDSVAGQLAVALARRLDDRNRDTGSGVASVSKELRAAMSLALRDVDHGADPVDELRARRETKRAFAEMGR